MVMGQILWCEKVKIFGEIGIICDYVYVCDVVLGIVVVMEFGVDGEVYNIGFGVGWNNCVVLDVIV